MKRDTVKTIAGLIIIGGIVVATFLYGNSQRQAQLTHDQDVKKQQDAKAAQAKAITAGTPTPGATAATPAAASNNTAPVTSPTTSALQGSATPTPGAVAGAATTATPAATPTGTIPTTGGTGLPETGPEAAGALGLGSITAMVIAVRRSRQAIIKAARKPR